MPLRMAIVPVTAFRQNCTVLFDPDTRRAMVVDPGGEPGRIIEMLLAQGLTVERILLTHGHLDHAGGAAGLREVLDSSYKAAGRPGVEIWGPDEADRFLLQSIEQQQERFGLQGLVNVLPDRWLQEGDVVPFGDWKFEAFHCPGHTPGSLVYVERGERLAFVGDVLFRGSIGRSDFAYGDGAALAAAIKEKLFPLGDDIHFIPGHGEGSTFGEERATNPFLQGA